MNTDPTDRAPTALDRQAVEALYAARVTARLTQALSHVDPAVGAQLWQARQQAVARARVQREEQAVVAAAAGVAAWSPPPRPPRWQRALTWVPVLAMIVGVWAIAQHQSQQRLRAAAAVDARLLTDVLPPAAYADPGFQEFLRQGGKR